jgi:2-polyprenyl-3-methyl-5-hydroxy-6-metoxy-1,4-benzoquinol methylase
MVSHRNDLEAHMHAYSSDFAHSFDNRIVLNWYAKRIMELVGPGLSLLELGLGHGYTSILFSEHFSRHVVIEGSKAVIGQFRKMHPLCTAHIEKTLFEEFDTEELFEVIIMGFVLEHVDDPIKILKHFRKYLAPGGRCFIAVPNGESLHRRLGKEAGLLTDLMNLSTGDIDLGHKRLYSVDSLKSDIQVGGYHLKKLEGIFLKPFSTEQLQSLTLDEKVLIALCRVGINYPELCCALLAQVEVQ